MPRCSGGKQHRTSNLDVVHSPAREQTVALELALIPTGTRLETNGHGESVHVSASKTRTFLCRLAVTDQIEQESLDVSIWGSTDGNDFGRNLWTEIHQRA